MCRNIVEQLFFGDICPSEHIGNDSSEYQKAKSLLTDAKAKFSQCLSEADREEFQRLEELQNKAAGIYSHECFVYGFKLAGSLLMEVVGGNKGCSSINNQD